MPVAVLVSKSKKNNFLSTPNSNSAVVVRVAVIGYGYWGPNLVRNFQDLDQSKVIVVADTREQRLKLLAKKFPDVHLVSRVEDVFSNPSVDAVVIATPVSTHFALAKAALEAGKHVFVEKPLAASARECILLTRMAFAKKKILMVGHTFEYNPAVLKVADLIKSKELGKLHYIDAVRVNLGLYQSDGRNVIWDLAPHDISIILSWIGTMPLRVSAWGQSFVHPGVEDVAFIRLEFPQGILAHIHVSWLSPAKIRRMTVVASRKMLLYDDLDQSEKIKIADRGAHLDPESTQARVGYRMGDIVSPHIDFKEPLGRECVHFIESICSGKKPLTDGENGTRVVRILEAADRSIKQGGKTILL